MSMKTRGALLGGFLGVEWLQMDLTDLSELASQSFDLIIEKFTWPRLRVFAWCQVGCDALRGPGAS